MHRQSERIVTRGPQASGATLSSTSPCPSCPVYRTGFCSSLDGRTLERLARHSARTKLRAHTRVPAPERGGSFGILISGYLGDVHHSADGQRRISSLTLPGEPLELAGPDGESQIEALTDVEICRIHGLSHNEVSTDSSGFRRLVYARLATKLDRLRELSVALSLLSPEERLAAFLVECRTMMPWQPLPGGGGILTMEIERSDIAALLGTTVESLSRITHRLDHEGMIRIRDPRHFEIPDLKRLRRRSGLGAWADDSVTADATSGASGTPRVAADDGSQ